MWAAESRDAVLCAHGGDDEAKLDGTKVWCSGAGLCTHALVTARLDNGRRALFAVDLRDEAVRSLPSTWRNPGMAGSDTRSVQFSGAPATAVGEPGAYLDRPGFWHGAIGVGACWLGGARAVAAPLYERAADDSADPHTLAHLGAVDAAIAAAEATLEAAARHVDADPRDRTGTAELVARRTRAVVGGGRRRGDHPHRPRARTGAAVPGRPACSTGCRSDDLCPAEPRRAGSGGVGATGGSQAVSASAADQPTGNGARFAARPLTGGGTPTPVWLNSGRRLPELDLTKCPEIVVVAPHPDDETLGFGATAVTLAQLGVTVQVVSVSDGGAAHPDRSPLSAAGWSARGVPNYTGPSTLWAFPHRSVSACPTVSSTTTSRG